MAHDQACYSGPVGPNVHSRDILKTTSTNLYMLFRKPDRVLYVTSCYCRYIRLISADIDVRVRTCNIIVDLNRMTDFKLKKKKLYVSQYLTLLFCGELFHVA